MAIFPKTLAAMFAAGMTCAAAPTAGLAQQAQQSPPRQDRGQAAGEAIVSDQAVGRRFQVAADRLPPPNTVPAVANPPLILPRAGHAPRVPEGFTATAFAEGLEHPRRMLVLPNGDLIVAEQAPGYLTLLRDDDGDGRAEWIQRHAEGFTKPDGLAWRDGHILVADQVGIWRVPHDLGAVRAGHAEPRPIGQVPPEQRRPDPNFSGQELITQRGVFGIVQGHVNRDIAIGPDGRLHVGVGSSGNIGVEPEPKATIQSFAADGSGQRTVASGLRNPTGLAFRPGTNELWAVVQERDGLGDRLPPDYLVRVREGAFYGYPYAYIGSNPQPGFADRAPDRVAATVPPDLLFEAHSAGMGVVFYDGAMFPPEYRGDAFVALKGSWNRSDPTGYKVVRVPFENGRPVGHYENFATGFWVSGRDRAEVWGRPVDVAVARDGALLVVDDTGGTIWRIAHTGGRGGATAQGAPDGARGAGGEAAPAPGAAGSGGGRR